MTKRPWEPTAMPDMSMTEVLATLGVTPETITEEDRGTLDEKGFATFPSLLDPTTLDRLRLRMKEIEQTEGSWGTDARASAQGEARVNYVHHKGAVFDQLWVYPTLLACMYHCLGDFRFESMSARTPKPGFGHQALHMDYWGPCEQHYMCYNTIWTLDDFTTATGTTRVVPGSHNWRQRPSEVLDDPLAPHPDEVCLEAPAGSLIVFNGYLWHSGTENTTEATRRGVFTEFARRDCRPRHGEIPPVPAAMADRLSAEARYILAAPDNSASPE